MRCLNRVGFRDPRKHYYGHISQQEVVFELIRMTSGLWRKDVMWLLNMRLLLMLYSQAQSSRLPHFGGVDVHFSGVTDCFVQVVKNKGVLSLWSGLTANTIKIVPYFGLLFACFELCKQICLYRNGYIVSPLSYTPAPGVDQSLRPAELQEVKRYLKNRSFGAASQSTIGNRW